MKQFDPPHHDQLEQEAVVWLIRLTSGDETAEDFTQFGLWRNRSPAHNQAYLKIAKLWEILDAPLLAWRQQMQAADTVKVDLAEQLAYPVKPVPKTIARSRFISGVIAASLLVVTTLGLFPDVWLYPWADYRTLIGGQAQVSLADGSVIHLNTNTAINTYFSANTRRVELLRGEAEFEVAHDRGRPFIVTSGAVSTQAVGTKFLVRYEGGEGLISLLEGKIHSFSQNKAAKADSGVTLSVGQQLQFKDNHIGNVTRFNADQASTWTNGRLLMNFVTLGQAIKEINRYRRGTVKLLDDNLAKWEINATIDLNYINAWLDALEATLPAKVHHFGPVILISSVS